jgi:hypothetical protein
MIRLEIAGTSEVSISRIASSASHGEESIMTSMTPRGEFYEDDEPVDDIVAAYESGDPGETRRPHRGQRGVTLNLALPELGVSEHPVADPETRTNGQLVRI